MSVRPPPVELVHAFGPVLADFVSRVNGALYWSGARQVNSWFRDVGTNRSVGGHACSQHLVGLAVDVQTDQRTDLFVALARRYGLVPVVEPSGRAVHVQYYPAGTLERLGACNFG